MKINNLFLFEIFKKIKNSLPSYLFKSIIKLLPLNLISSVFEIFGLFILFPVIKIILEPEIIDNNRFINSIYLKLNFQNHISFVLFLFTTITLLFILKNFIIYFISKKQINVTHDLAARLALDRYNSYLNKPYIFHSNNNPAVLLRNFVQMPFELINYIILPFIAVINEIFILLLIIVGITFYDPVLFSTLILFLAPLFLLYNKIYKKKLVEISSKRDFESADMFKLGLQSMEAYREITIFNKINFFKPLFNKTLKNYGKLMSDSYLINAMSPKFVETIAVLTIFSIFLMGYLLNKNIESLAQFLIVFAIAAFRLIPSMNKIILSLNYLKSSSFVFKHYDIREEDFTNEKHFDSNENTGTIKFNEKLVIKNLSYSFDKKHDVLKNINLKINKGSTIGIIGTSGAGKTTFLNILLRLFEETDGGIYVDELKIEKSNLTSWYKLVSYVPQNIILLDGTISENIAFGIPKHEIDQELLEQVIKQAQLDDFIAQSPEGIDSEIGEKGIKISGGQRQRIGIARALYHGGSILIFDEATSALDTETETMLTDAINNISHKNLTIIIVAHRIQTLKYCDVIYKLNKGEIEEQKPMEQDGI